MATHTCFTFFCAWRGRNDATTWFKMAFHMVVTSFDLIWFTTFVWIILASCNDTTFYPIIPEEKKRSLKQKHKEPEGCPTHFTTWIRYSNNFINLQIDSTNRFEVVINLFTVRFSHMETLLYQQFCALQLFITFADPMSLKTKYYLWLEIGRFRSALFIFVFKASLAVQKCNIQ